MRTTTSLAKAVVFVTLSTFILAACDSSADRAAAHYERGLAFVESGETEKAILEFRNALQLNQDALEPRLEFARLLLAKGDLNGAAGNFLKVVELDPNHLEARIETGRIFLLAGNKAEATLHINAAFELASENTDVRALKSMLDYREDRKAEAIEMAKGVLADDPGNVVATMVAADQLLNDGALEEVVSLSDAAIAKSPEDLGLQLMKLRALELLGDTPKLAAHLVQMQDIFPENDQITTALVQLYLNENDQDAAEKVLRDLAASRPDDPKHALSVVAFLREYGEPAEARSEIEGLVAGSPDNVVFGRALAELDFIEGDAAKAIAGLRALLEVDGITDEERLGVEVQLAGVLRQTGDHDAAREVIASVLSRDSESVEALKLRALYAIDDDRPDDAITDLRVALDVSAQDPTILMILATAHERNGSRGLAQDRLALAVQASGAGVVESLRYADFLVQDEKFDIAEDVLVTALRENGERLELLTGVAQVFLRNSDFQKADAIVDRLRALDTEESNRIASELKVSVLNLQEKFEGSIDLLEQLWSESGDTTSVMENLVRSYMAKGDVEAAASFLDGILADEPKNLRANLLRAAVHAFARENDQAEAIYRSVIANFPDQEFGYGALAGLLSQLGRIDEANEIVKQGIENSAEAPRLLLGTAIQLEQRGLFEEAIKIYQELYTSNKRSDVLANNLASLLSEHRDDPESLEQAFAVAKRLRGSDVPAFQDTLGWVLYKRGDYEQALPPLTVAVEGLPNNYVVLYHYGMVLEKLGQKEKAIEYLTRAVEEAGPDATWPQATLAREALDALNTAQ